MNAYIQSSLEKKEGKSSTVSSLKAVVSFLYCLQIILFSVLGTLMGVIVDDTLDVTGSMKWTAGVQFTVIAGLSLLGSLIPKGAFAINPKAIGLSLDKQESVDEEIERAQDEETYKTEVDDAALRNSMGSPVILDLDTIPRAMPRT